MHAHNLHRYLMEFIGTFFLTIAICFSNGNALAAGLMLMTVIFVGRSISGGHFNPCFSLAAWLEKELDMSQAIGYFISQVAGAVLAGILVMKVIGMNFPINLPVDLFGISVAFAFELLFAFLFSLVYINVVSQGKTVNNVQASFIIGLALCALVLIGGTVNPAVALASLINLTDMVKVLIVLVVGPLIGAFGAFYLFKFMHAK